MYLCKSLQLLEAYLIENGIISSVEKYLVQKGYEDDLSIYNRGAFFINGYYIKITTFRNKEAFRVEKLLK